MKKLALLVVVLSVFVVSGCSVSPVEKQWGMADNGIGYVQEVLEVDDEYGTDIYVFVISYGGKESEPFRTYDDRFLYLRPGDEVHMRLSNYNSSQGSVTHARYWAYNTKIDAIYGRRISFGIDFKKWSAP